MTFDALRAAYRRSLAERIAILSAARRALVSDPSAVSLILAHAHKLHGSGALYGYTEVSEAAAAVREADPNRLGHAVDALIAVMEEIS